MNLEPMSLGIGLLIGLAVGLLIRRRRIEVAAQAAMRDLRARLTTVNLRLERTQNELVATKGVVAKLLEDRSKSRDQWQAGTESPLMVVLNDAEANQLSQIKGIGPKQALSLASYGITDLARLADVTERDLSIIEASAPNLAGRMIREQWKEQALAFLQGPQTRDETSRDEPSRDEPSRDEYSQEEESMTPAADEYSWAKFRTPSPGRAASGSS